MRDLLAVAVYVGLVAIVCWLTSRKGLLAWARDEWRAMRTRTFDPAAQLLSSSTSERTTKLVMKQRALGKRMRRQGRGLLANKQGRRKAYVPAAGTPDITPTQSEKVVPLRRFGTK